MSNNYLQQYAFSHYKQPLWSRSRKSYLFIKQNQKAKCKYEKINNKFSKAVFSNFPLKGKHDIMLVSLFKKYFSSKETCFVDFTYHLSRILKCFNVNKQYFQLFKMTVELDTVC